MHSLEGVFGCLEERVYLSKEIIYFDLVIEDNILKDHKNNRILCILNFGSGELELTF